ncbi:MAG: hypothetical protein ACOCVG_04015 [Verrucomicrobiota bacterium]
MSVHALGEEAAKPAEKGKESAPAEASKLKPGELLRWEFPEHPPSLWTLTLGRQIEVEHPPTVSVQLPENYSSDRDFPLLLFMGGAWGDPGRRPKPAEQLVGLQDFILVSIPLFLSELERIEPDEANKWSRLYIGSIEGDYLWQLWKPMLEKVFAEVPNIDRKRTFIGGFSNGANATAAVLNDPEGREWMLQHFSHFVLVEGGKELKPDKDLSEKSFLLINGQKSGDWLRPLAETLITLPSERTTYRIMPEVGHEFPDEEKTRAAKWIRDQAKVSK